MAGGLATVAAAAMAAEFERVPAAPRRVSAVAQKEAEILFTAATEEAEAEINADWQTIAAPARPMPVAQEELADDEFAWGNESAITGDEDLALFELLDPAAILGTQPSNFLAMADYVEPELLEQLDHGHVVTADETSADENTSLDLVGGEDDAVNEADLAIAPDAPIEEAPAPEAPDEGIESAPVVEGNVVPPEPDQPPPAPPSQFRPITAIRPDFDYDPEGKSCEHLCPQDPDCPAPDFECPEDTPFVTSRPYGRNFAPTQYMWMASNLYHRPLYFQDVQLERYGHVKCNEACQAVESLGKFGVQLVGLPYQMALDYPWSHRYSLGYYRPGDCAPKLCYQVPLNCKAAITSTAFYTGIVFLLN